MQKIVFALIASLSVAGCTVDQANVPPFSGPSEFAVSVTLTATPDQLPRDGSSQSVITAFVRDASSQPVAGQRLGISPSVGSVSQSEIVTDEAGRATFAFVAPVYGTVGNSATISVTPVGSNAANATARTLIIAFVGPSNTGAPTFAQTHFTVTPAAPEVAAAVRFDASGITDSAGKPEKGVFDEGKPCLDGCSYSWDFGDGSSGSGRIAFHTYSAGRSYTVTLTVTDAAGSTASAATVIPVAAVAAPTVTLTVAPNPPLAGQQATFTATATPAKGHSIARYAWDFGDGSSTTTTSSTVTKTYSSVGAYVATVTVTDDLGQIGSATLLFTISSNGVTANVTVSPTAPKTTDTVQFNGSASTGSAGSTITQWAWDFGDGNTETKTVATTSHQYSAAGTYVVRLTVTDSAGRTGSTTAQVAVTAP